ncbi:hypothetical protein FRACYDRAFT_237202 [Fragilariopsis cylindrus CCMP1102]|uniref:BTB domain-containing protein n=1 Tax=Fragilariopsis cylindrus CCMP1102 TaxID=635003 RepID=A0A1E7FL66_9STRA|nr:hypothetical protein FRACYDRAFT_237202 [Fragilariopsis cylindrus CCMP1102]|eukprot:OEU18918.1 hypothetical protein FRACYDRAFT_237202 [Fragilariopsis cylindrus CCMP1102]
MGRSENNAGVVASVEALAAVVAEGHNIVMDFNNQTSDNDQEDENVHSDKEDETSSSYDYDKESSASQISLASSSSGSGGDVPNPSSKQQIKTESLSVSIASSSSGRGGDDPNPSSKQQIKKEEISKNIPDKSSDQVKKSNSAAPPPPATNNDVKKNENNNNSDSKNNSTDNNKRDENDDVRQQSRRQQQNRGSGHNQSGSSNKSLGRSGSGSSHHRRRRRPSSGNKSTIGRGGMNRLSASHHQPSTTTSLSKNKSVERASRRKSHEIRVVSMGDNTSINNNNTDRRFSGTASESSKRKVSWKSDPKASFSDYTIEILYHDEIHNQPHVDVYYIHRNITGFGSRKSQYLLRHFQEEEVRQVINNSTNNNNPTIQIKLPTEIQAKAFPLVLDFFYDTKEIKQKLTAEMSCNVFKLSELLEIQSLSKAIGDFYMKNLSLKNLGDFLMAATKVKADKLLTICKAKIGQMITEKPELSRLVPPKFMADILWISRKQLDEARSKEPDKYTEELVISQSKYWSKAACICAAQNESILTLKLFERLTSSESLPYIDASAAPKLLSIESSFLLSLNSNNNNPMTASMHSSNENNEKDENKKKVQLTSLQQRCVESIANDFERFQKCFDSSEAVSDSLSDLPSNVLTEILLRSLNK